MKRFPNLVSLAIAVVCGAWVAAGTGVPVFAATDEQAVIRADRSFVQEVAANRGADIEKLLDADFFWTDAAGKTLTRAEGKPRRRPSLRSPTRPASSERFAITGTSN